MRYLTMFLPAAVVALGALIFVADANAGHRRGGCGCGCDCGSAAVTDKAAPPAVAQKPDSTRTERSYSVEPSTEYAPRYRSGRGTSGWNGLDYTQRQKSYRGF